MSESEVTLLLLKIENATKTELSPGLGSNHLGGNTFCDTVHSKSIHL
jgi:hypothetical protein